MKIPTSFLPPLLAILASPLAIGQDSAVTVPVGVVLTQIEGSVDGSTHEITFLSPTLLNPPSAQGTLSGRIANITANTVTVSEANWLQSELVSQGPNYIYFKSGNAAGLMLYIAENSVDVLTLDTEGYNLESLGIAVGPTGDQFEIVKGDTVASLFGGPDEGVVGGSATDLTNNRTDKIVIKDNAGILRTIYWNTASSGWRRNGSASDMGVIRISPNSGLAYYRISTEPLTLDNTGTVPSVHAKQIISTSGPEMLARFIPVDTTLGELGIENLSGWRKAGQEGVTIQTADKVVCKDTSGIIRMFYYDGTKWRRQGSGSTQNQIPIPTGSMILTSRFGPPGKEIHSMSLPYSLSN